MALILPVGGLQIKSGLLLADGIYMTMLFIYIYIYIYICICIVYMNKIDHSPLLDTWKQTKNKAKSLMTQPI
jgi:uncharacterized ion transporter superfamily protein YfcC